MPAQPLALVPNFDQQICDAIGAPLVGGTLEFLLAGSDTPAAVYADPDGVEAMTNPVELDSSGRPTQGAIYVAAHGYKVIVRDIDGVEQYTRDVFEDVGAVFASTYGALSTAGAKNVTGNYEILDSDRLITIDSPTAVTVTLLPAADAPLPVTLKNIGAGVVTIALHGADTLEGLTGPFEIAGAASPNMPTITLASDLVSAWYVQSSHALVNL